MITIIISDSEIYITIANIFKAKSGRRQRHELELKRINLWIIRGLVLAELRGSVLTLDCLIKLCICILYSLYSIDPNLKLNSSKEFRSEEN